MTMPTLQRPGVADFYEHQVLPALMDRLDQAFPEFGWRRDARGWVATSAEYTRSTLGARPDRVVCHGDAPRGFLIHGQGAVLWTTYLNDGHPARGRDFIAAVGVLAERAGVDAGVLDRVPTAAERRASLLAEAFAVAQRELSSDRGDAARAYLGQRGIPAGRIPASELGLMPSRERLSATLLSVGYTSKEIDASQLLADQRFPGRIIGAWRDEHQHPRTLWARTIDPDDEARYLYLRSAQRPGDVPYALAGVLARHARDAQQDLVLVEGVLDVHTLHAHDIHNVAALGGLAASRRLFEHLADLGVDRIFLAFDNDPPGRLATNRAVDAATHAERSPDVWVIDPDLLSPHKDPGELVQRDGIRAWHTVTAPPACGIAWRALELTGPLDEHDTELARRAALNRAASWLGGLPPRLAVEQDAALDHVANTLGHDRNATRRTFRAATGNTRRASIRHNGSARLAADSRRICPEVDCRPAARRGDRRRRLAVNDKRWPRDQLRASGAGRCSSQLTSAWSEPAARIVEVVVDPLDRELASEQRILVPDGAAASGEVGDLKRTIRPLSTNRLELRGISGERVAERVPPLDRLVGSKQHRLARIPPDDIGLLQRIDARRVRIDPYHRGRLTRAQTRGEQRGLLLLLLRPPVAGRRRRQSAACDLDHDARRHRDDSRHHQRTVTRRRGGSRVRSPSLFTRSPGSGSAPPRRTRSEVGLQRRTSARDRARGQLRSGIHDRSSRSIVVPARNVSANNRAAKCSATRRRRSG
jgi:hypothetical protein